MKKRTALIARLNKLEQRQHGRRMPKVVFAVDGLGDADVVAIQSGKVHLLRQADEPLSAFEARAFAVTGAQFLFHCYAASSIAAERDYEAEWHSARAGSLKRALAGLPGAF